MRPLRILAVTASAVLGAALGVGAAIALDHQPVEDPLGLGASMVNQACQENQALLVLVPGDTAGDLASDLASHDGARYLQTAHSCRTAWRRPDKPVLTYVAYLGPFTRGAACEKQMTGSYRGAHVTMLTQDSPDTVPCACYVSRAGIPVLRPGQQLSDQEIVYLHDVQRLLTELGIRPDVPFNDFYDHDMEQQVRQFQQNRGHVATGVMGRDTWRALLRAGCA